MGYHGLSNQFWKVEKMKSRSKLPISPAFAMIPPPTMMSVVSTMIGGFTITSRAISFTVGHRAACELLSPKVAPVHMHAQKTIRFMKYHPLSCPNLLYHL